MTVHEYSSRTIFNVFLGISSNLILKSSNEDSSSFLPSSTASWRLINFSDALIECLAFSVTTKLSHPGSGRKFSFVLIFTLCPFFRIVLGETDKPSTLANA